MAKIYGIYDFKGIPRQPTNEELEAAKSLGFPDIIGVVEGTHFVPDGASRNKRWYSNELWDNALRDPDVVRKMQNHTMFGRIGHDAEITENEIAEGKFSHFTTDLALLKDNIPGFARTYIVNTKMGQILLMLLRGCKSKLYVSSRADGSFLPQEINGCKVLDPKTYKLERFDFVVEPGFLQAEPKLVESLSTDDLNFISEAEKVSESILSMEDADGKADTSSNETAPANENNQNKMTYSIEALLEENNSLREDNNSLKTKLEESEKSQKSWLTKLMSFGLANSGKYSAEDFIKKFEDDTKAKFSDEEKAEIETSAKDAKWLKESLSPDANATPGDGIEGKEPTVNDSTTLPTISDEDRETLELVKELGGITAIKDALNFVDDYFTRVGTPQQIESILDNFDKIFKKLGSPVDIEECLNRVNAFCKKNGTFESIEQMLEKAKKSKKKEQQLEKILDDLRKENESLRKDNENFKKTNESFDSQNAKIASLEKTVEAYKLSNETGVDFEKVMAKFNEGLDYKSTKDFFERSTPKVESVCNESNGKPQTIKLEESHLVKVFGWNKNRDED